MCGNCRCGRSHRPSVRMYACGRGCRRTDGNPRSSRKECYRDEVPWMSSRAEYELFILGCRWKRGQMGCADSYWRVQFKVFHARAFELGVNQPAHCFLAIDNTVSAY